MSGKRDLWFQYLIGENQGKVVKLSYIDDNDPFFNLFVFDDGFKCNKSLVALFGDVSAKKDNKILAQVSSPSALWKISTKEIKPDDTRTAVSNQDGQKYYAADPYFFNKEGNQLHQEKTIDEAIPPSDYMSGSYPASLLEPYKLSNYLEPHKLSDYSVKEKTSIEKATKAEKDSQSSIKQNPIMISENGDKEENSEKSITTEKEKIQESSLRKKNDEENNIMHALTKKAKKTPRMLMVPISIDLPDDSFYSFLSKNYAKEDIDDFLDCVIRDLNIDMIKNNIRDAVRFQYEKKDKALVVLNDTENQDSSKSPFGDRSF